MVCPATLYSAGRDRKHKTQARLGTSICNLALKIIFMMIDNYFLGSFSSRFSFHFLILCSTCKLKPQKIEAEKNIHG